MMNVGLTGNVGSGKSTVARWFAGQGAMVIDSDALVREVQSPGSPTLAHIAQRFGADVLTPAGELNRAVLRGRVMGDRSALDALNAIVHPAVLRRREELLGAASQNHQAVVVSDIPLLFEVLDPGGFDLVVLVDAPVALRRQRLMDLRHLSAEEADRMIAAQLPADGKRRRSHIVIENRGSLEELERNAQQAWAIIVAVAERRAPTPAPGSVVLPRAARAKPA